MQDRLRDTICVQFSDTFQISYYIVQSGFGRILDFGALRISSVQTSNIHCLPYFCFNLASDQKAFQIDSNELVNINEKGRKDFFPIFAEEEYLTLNFKSKLILKHILSKALKSLLWNYSSVWFVKWIFNCFYFSQNQKFFWKWCKAFAQFSKICF